MSNPLKAMPLLTGVNLALTPVGPEAGAEATRFSNVFRTTWRKLPIKTREALAAAWSVNPAVIYLTPKFGEQVRRLAQCSAKGTIFHFFSPALPRMSDEVLAVCIAHELAHAFFYVTNDPYHCGGLDSCFYDNQLQYRLAEALAHELCDAWGFKPRILGQWCVDNSVWLDENLDSSQRLF